MAVTNIFGGGYNVQERPVEYYKANSKDKSLKSISIDNNDFNKALNTANKNKATKVNFNKPIQNDNLSNQNGTDIARLKDVAKEFADQFYGFLWNQMNERVNENPEGGFGEAMFQKSLWPELVKTASGDELDSLGQAIFKDLMRQQGYKEKNDIK